MQVRDVTNTLHMALSASNYDLEQQIEAFADYFNNHRYLESLNDLTRPHVNHGRRAEILKLGEKKRNTQSKMTLAASS